MTVGIPRALFYYYDGGIWKKFLDSLNVSYILSDETNDKILDLGRKYASDEMCFSMQIYLGHVASLVGKCDMILVPRIDNYGRNNQTCTNFLACQDIVQNLFPVHLLRYNINEEGKEREEDAYIKMGMELGYSKEESLAAYHNALVDRTFTLEHQILKNIEALKSPRKKILLISHPYNTYDRMIGEPILKFLKEQNIEIIYADLFHKDILSDLSKKISESLYFKYNKELLGAIPLCEEKVDGILFLTAFPCGIDSLANELAMRKIKKPSLNIVVDSQTSIVGLETRIESFLDILEGGV